MKENVTRKYHHGQKGQKKLYVLLGIIINSIFIAFNEAGCRRVNRSLGMIMKANPIRISFLKVYVKEFLTYN